MLTHVHDADIPIGISTTRGDVTKANHLRQVPTQGAGESMRVNNVSVLNNEDIHEQHEPVSPKPVVQ